MRTKKLTQEAPACRYCGSTKWAYKTTKTIDIDGASQQKGEPKLTAQEIRCGACDMKATKRDLPAIMAMSVFKKIKEQETANV